VVILKPLNLQSLSSATESCLLSLPKLVGHRTQTGRVGAVRGIVLLLSAMLFFAVQDAVVKFVIQTFAVMQVLTWRLCFVVVLLTIIVVSKAGFSVLVTAHWRLMCVRGLIAFLAFTIYYIALIQLPLADAATVLMTAPLFVTALSVPLLGEHVGLHRWGAVFIGFAGVVILLNPGADLFRPIILLPLISAFFYSMIPILTRLIDAQESSLAITFYTALTYAILCLIVSAAIHLWPATPTSNGLWKVLAEPWQAFTLAAWGWVFLSSLLFTIGVLAITLAYRVSEVSLLAPFEFVYILWAVIVGFVVFSDVPSIRVLIAGTIVAISGIYIALREAKLKSVNA